jgi:uncharacterized protein (TIGR02147 family)
VVDIFGYTDYRSFLKDWFEWRKGANHGFSFRALAEQAGFRNKGFLHNVMSGKKNLSGPSALQLAQALGLSASEAQYFECLVAFNQAATLQERNVLFDRLQSVRTTRKGVAAVRSTRGDQIEYYSTWYHSAVRSLLGMHDYADNWSALARALHPRITPRQARESVELLLRLHLVERSAEGRLELIDRTITAGPEVLQLGYQRFQLEMNERARQAAMSLPKAVRHVSGTTLGISRAGYEKCCAEIDALRQRLMVIAESDAGADECYQLTVNLFPLSCCSGALHGGTVPASKDPAAPRKKGTRP